MKCVKKIDFLNLVFIKKVNTTMNINYPTFKQMQKKLERRLDLWSEYGQVNHDCCKAIYENPDDEDLVVKMGKIIYQRGGMTALQANYYIIVYEWSNKNLASHLEKVFEKVSDEWQM